MGFLDAIAVVDMVGLVVTGLAGGALGVGMPLLLLAGMIDGPTGGRLAERAAARHERRSEVPAHGRAVPQRPAA